MVLTQPPVAPSGRASRVSRAGRTGRPGRPGRRGGLDVARTTDEPPVQDPVCGGSARRNVLVVAAIVPPLVLALLLVARQPLGENAAFLPAFLTLVLGADVLTAVLLGEQYRNGAGPRMLVMSWAYSFSSVSIVFHFLTFPGVVSADGLMGAVPSSAAWLWTSWHAGFALLLGLALGPWPHAAHTWLARQAGRGRRLVLSNLLAAAAASSVAAWVTLGSAGVPTVSDGQNYELLTRTVGPWMTVVVLLALGLALSGFVARGRTGPESWGLVAVVVSGGDVALTLLAGDRFTLGWYSARALALAASVIVLLALLHEISGLHRRVRRDAQRLAEQNAELLAAQDARDRLTAVVTHDMRTPVTGLAGYLELLEEGDLPPEQVHRMVLRGQGLTRRLTLMIEDLLTAANRDLGVLDVHPRSISVRQSLEDSAAAFPDVDVRLDCPADLRVTADPLRLQQVIDNLLTNAVKYGAEPVRLEAGAVDGTVTISVADAGDGVPDAFVDHLFDRYARAPEHEGTAAGSGLGLSVVRDLVEAHGGTVGYDRARRAFDVRLPERPDVVSLDRTPTEVPVRDAG